MAYSQIKNPRFWVDHFQYALTTGLISPDVPGKDFGQGSVYYDGSGGGQAGQTNLFYLNWADRYDISKLFYLNPTNTLTIPFKHDDRQNKKLIVDTGFNYSEDLNLNYAMVLNHNLKNANARFYVEGFDDDYNYSHYANPVGFKNWLSTGETIEYNGWSGYTFDSSGSAHENIKINFYLENNQFGLEDIKIGAISIGKYFDLDAPDLNLNLTYDYSGIKSMISVEGNEFNKINYSSVANWTSAPWDLYSNNPNKIRRNGKRIWDLSFSSYSENNLFNKYEYLNEIVGSQGEFDYTSNPLSVLETDEGIGRENTLMDTLMRKTLGGSLPFIFQPDNTNFDDMSICLLDMKSFSVTQNFLGRYKFKLKVVEL